MADEEFIMEFVQTQATKFSELTEGADFEHDGFPQVELETWWDQVIDAVNEAYLNDAELDTKALLESIAEEAGKTILEQGGWTVEQVRQVMDIVDHQGGSAASTNLTNAIFFPERLGM